MLNELCCNIDSNFGVNSSLLSNNSFYNLTRDESKFHLIHVTKNKDRIMRDGFLYPSSGCLIGSVYFVPGYEMAGGKIRMHNLGAYYYTQEAPLSLKLKNRTDVPNIFIIEISLKKKERANILGVNYLKLGKLHYDIYNELAYLLNRKERECLEKITQKRVFASKDFLQKLSDNFYRKKIGSNEAFLKLFREKIKYLPILGYVYFEAINKTMMLHQDDEKSILYKEIGEFYNWHYKDLMTYLYPRFFANFNVGIFNPDFKDVLKFIKKRKIISSIDGFINDFYSQLFYLTNMVTAPLDKISSSRIKYLCDFPENYNHLLGHLIHRELRGFSRYPDFYFYFDQMKALKMWNFWNSKKVLIPFNSIIPKGEIGLNPAFVDNVNYNIYEAVNFKEKDGCFFVDKGKETNLKVAKRLVDHNHLFMRNC